MLHLGTVMVMRQKWVAALLGTIFLVVLAVVAAVLTQKEGEQTAGDQPSANILPQWAVINEYPQQWGEGVKSEEISGCVNNPELDKCLTEWSIKTLDGREESLKKVLLVLNTYTLSNKDFFSNYCHEVWHDVGEHVGSLYDLETILTNAVNTCHGGIVHGAMSGRAAEVGLEAFLKEADGICDRYAGWPSIYKNDCIHGVGHGYGNVSKWEGLYTACAPFEKDPEEFDWCATGAIETLFQRQVDYNIDIGVKTTELAKRCSESDLTKSVCWRYSVFPQLAEGAELQNIARDCEKWEGADRKWCSFAIGGVAASGWEYGGDDLNICDSMIDEFKNECWKGAARSVARGSERFNATKSPRAAELPETHRISLCNMVPNEVKTWCLDMEKTELGDELDQKTQLDLLRRWNAQNQLGWSL